MEVDERGTQIFKVVVVVCCCFKFVIIVVWCFCFYKCTSSIIFGQVFVQIYLNVRSYEQDIHMSFIHNEEMKLMKF